MRSSYVIRSQYNHLVSTYKKYRRKQSDWKNISRKPFQRNEIKEAVKCTLEAKNEFCDDAIVDVKPEQKIYFIGDVHGDLDALIVCLRDLIGAIIYRDCDDGEEYYVNMKHYIGYQNDSKYNLTEQHLKNEYDVTLGFEWNVTNTVIVILGDVLDRKRGNYIKSKSNKIGEVVHEELKIVLFLNYLHYLAEIEKKGNKIIRLFGNHEKMNIDGNNSNYVSDIGTNCYFENVNRLEYFKRMYTPFRYLTDNARIIVAFDKFVAVHGGMYPTHIEKITDFNMKSINVLNLMFKDLIYGKNNYYQQNKILQPFINDHIDTYLIRNNQTEATSIYWNRYFGETFTQTKTNDTNDDLCRNVDTIFNKLCYSKNNCLENLVISHCPNYFYKRRPGYSFTFQNTSSDANVSRTYEFSGDKIPLSGRAVSDDDKQFYFGISADCGKYIENIAKSAKIWRVDIGMSRAFGDFKKLNDETVRRLPQVLYFSERN
jgi:hypothetical protein